MIGGLFLAIQTDSFQTWLARIATTYLSSELDAKVTVERVSIRFFNRAALKGIYIEDTKGDTLFWFDELVVDINDISTSKKRLAISKLTLHDSYFNLIHRKGEAHDNLYFLLDYFTSGDTTVSDTAAWKITAEELELDGFRFRYDDWNEPADTSGVDFSHLYVSEVKGDFHGFDIVNDSIFAKVDRLSFHEKSGFHVKEFSADAKVSGTQIRTNGLRIVTDKTDIDGDLTFDYSDWEDFDDFIEKVDWRGRLTKSKVSFRDIAYFTSELSGLDKAVSIEGRFHGNVGKFKVNDLDLGWGEGSYVRGSVFINGLPELDETSMDLRITDASTNVKDVEWLPLFPFDSGQHLRLPDNIRLLKDVQFKGRFTGFLSNFNAYGDFKTGLGYVSANLNVTYDQGIRNYIYEGKLTARDFDIGSFTYTPRLGKTTFGLEVDGKGIKLNDIRATMAGNIERLFFNGYDYTGIRVNGSIAKKQFHGDLETHGEDVDLVFQGGVDLSKDIPEFDFTSHIERLHLNRINLLDQQEQYILRTDIESDFVGDEIDDLEGGLLISNSFLQVDQKMYHINSVSLAASNLPEKRRSLRLVSDLLDANMDGSFQLDALPITFRDIIPRYLPNVLIPIKGEIQPQDFNFNIHFKNTSLITDNYIPDLYVDPETRMQGYIKGDDRSFDIRLTSPLIRYGDTRWISLNTSFATSDNHMSIAFKSDTVYYSSDGFIPHCSLSGKAASNDIDFRLLLANDSNQASRLDWRGHMYFRAYDDFDLMIDSSDIIIEGLPWLLDPGNMVTYDTSGIRIRRVAIHRESESIAINGVISKDPAEELVVIMDSFMISHLNPALRSSGFSLGGNMTGTARLSELYTSTVLKSAMEIDRLMVNGDSLGNLSFTTDYESAARSLLIDAEIINGSAKIARLKGKLKLDDKSDALDFKLTTDNFYLHPLEKFADSIITDLRGRVSADLDIKGSLDKPVIEGFLDLKKVSATVAYLNTRYNLTSKVRVKKDLIDLNGVRIFDQFGNYADVSGGVTHDNFSDFRLDVTVNAKNLEAIKTDVIHNNYYYGNAFVTGRASFVGPIETIKMTMNLSPEKNTRINIPFNTATEVTISDFITFVQPNTILDFEKATNKMNLGGMSLVMNLDMNSNAEINLIFDEKIGDVISGSGNGNLKLEVTEDGLFKMGGTFTIESGSYLFTLQNLINKKFKIDPGGTVTWVSDPYNARIDMSAVYTTNTASLVNLIQDSTFQRRVNVDCRLNLTGALMNPNITYDISIKNQDATLESMVKTVLNSEQEINRQMFGLLVFNQFLPPSTSTASASRLDAGAGAVASASEMLSNQVSNWLSQLSNDVNIGFNYRAKDSYSNEEVQLMFSKTLFNDRLLVETNVGVTGNTVASASVAGSTNANSLVGEFFTEYKVSGDGRFRLKAYNRSNADDLINFNAPYTQGFGMSFRQDFDNWADLRQRLKRKEKKVFEIDPLPDEQQ